MSPQSALTEVQQKAMQVSSKNRASSWIGPTHPTVEASGYHFSPNEYHDAVALRIAWIVIYRG